jgi:hypothetical protein
MVGGLGMGRPLVQDGTALDFVGLPLYPRMHIISDGRVFMSGTNAETKLLKTSAPGSWETVGSRKAGARLPRQPNRSASIPMEIRPTRLGEFPALRPAAHPAVPYIYTYVNDSASSGLPVKRPPVLLHQEDTRTHSLKHTYCFGNEFLVAPALEPTQPGSVTERVV